MCVYVLLLLLCVANSPIDIISSIISRSPASDLNSLTVSPFYVIPFPKRTVFFSSIYIPSQITLPSPHKTLKSSFLQIPLFSILHPLRESKELF
ncbi:hypothetical protein VNO77_24379 [Canavalia gladiata]|uniref:Secreted protein n=1 Tax=Canavalia gladiata TaxID=3824 RepID=A0AAN9L661_CANGL